MTPFFIGLMLGLSLFPLLLPASLVVWWAVGLEAARHIEHERNSDCDSYDALTRSYIYCREQAKKEQP